MSDDSESKVWRIRLIGSDDEPDAASLYWSNIDGWVYGEDATRFTDDERKCLNLPLEGEWSEVHA